MVEQTRGPSRFDEDELTRLQERLAAIPKRRLGHPGPQQSGVEETARAREAAVLVSLCHHRGEAAVLFTKRSDKVGTHKGQVSFPGGMADEEDDGPEATALRELDEEVGLAPAQVRVLGKFHEAQAITGVKVIPVIGFLGEIEPSALTVSEAEIDHVFALTFAELLDKHKRYDRVLGARGPHPVFDAGPFPVWGLTAWILREVLEELFDIELGPGLATPKTGAFSPVQDFHRP